MQGQGMTRSEIIQEMETGMEFNKFCDPEYSVSWAEVVRLHDMTQNWPE